MGSSRDDGDFSNWINRVGIAGKTPDHKREPKHTPAELAGAGSEKPTFARDGSVVLDGKRFTPFGSAVFDAYGLIDEYNADAQTALDAGYIEHDPDTQAYVLTAAGEAYYRNLYSSRSEVAADEKQLAKVKFLRTLQAKGMKERREAGDPKTIILEALDEFPHLLAQQGYGIRIRSGGRGNRGTHTVEIVLRGKSNRVEDHAEFPVDLEDMDKFKKDILDIRRHLATKFGLL